MVLNIKSNFKLNTIRKNLLIVSLLLILLSTYLTTCMVTANATELPFNPGIPVRDQVELRAAVTAAATSREPTNIIFENDITLTGTPLTIPRNADITLTSDSDRASGNGVEFFKLNGASGQNTILVDGGGVLKLAGIIVTHASGSGRGVEVRFSGVLELRSGVISGNTLSGNGAGVLNSGIFRMYGGMISGNAANYGGGVYNSDGTFILDAGVISNNKAAYYGAGVYSTGIFSMRGGEISSNTITYYYSGGGVYNSGNFVLESGSIIGNYAILGGGVCSTSTFTMSGGVISGNTVNSDGGGVYSSGSSLKLSGGVISGNVAPRNGGGVYSSGGLFELSDCVISGNIAVNGGGVWRSGAFSMSNAIVSDNHVSGVGGGVYKHDSGSTFSMYGGMISGNTADGAGGGGVYINYGNFEMFDGGIISNNRAPNGGGVFLSNGLVHLYSGKVSDNYANLGGGVWVTNTYGAALDRLTVEADVEFSGNRANRGYDRQPADDDRYHNRIKCTVWSDPFKQGYNNYDISYVRGSPLTDFTVNVINGSTKWLTYISDGSIRAAVPITANAAPEGEEFKYWTADSADVIFADPYSSVTSFLMPPHPTVVTANFGPIDSTSIAVTAPSKLVYVVGEALDLTGMVVTVTYSDGSTKDVTNSAVVEPANGEVLNVVGILSVKVSYTEGDITMSSSFIVTVNPFPVMLESIAVTALPNKLSYFISEGLDFTGMVVTAYYSDSTSKEVTDYNTNPPEGTKPFSVAEETVIISYTEGDITKSASFTVEVKPVYLQKIDVALPNKTVYTIGETLDLTGMVVVAYRSDGSSNIVTGYTTSPENGAPLDAVGEQTVTVNYAEYSIWGGGSAQNSFTVVVNDLVELDSIVVTTLPSKLSYIVGEALDLEGLVVTASYSDGSRRAVMNYITVPIDGDVLLEIDYQIVTISYTEGDILSTNSFVVTVTDATVEYVVHYYLEGTTISVFADKVVTGQTLGTSVTEWAIHIDSYIATAPTYVTAVLKATDNVFVFYYRTVPAVEYVIHYYLEGTTISVADDFVGSSWLGYYLLQVPKDIAGYTSVSPVLMTTLNAFGNEFAFYYTPNTNTAYTIVHYAAVGDGVLLSEALTGTTGTVVNAEVATIVGYTFDATDGRNVLSGAVMGDGSLVLELYYTINQYTITYNLNDGVNAVGNPGWFTVEDLPLGIADPTKNGYVFLGWSVQYSDGRPSVTVLIPSFVIHVGTACDITLTAAWNPIEVTVVSATPTAFVTQLNGNKNDLTISITEKLSSGTTNVITKTFSINNNAADTYTVGSYRVYVDTKGNTQIRACYLV